MPGSPGPTLDGASKLLLSYAAVPGAAVGDSLRSWTFYAANTNPVKPVIFDASGAVIGYGATVTPSGTGLQSSLFGLQAGTDILAAGNTVGFYYPGAASIPFHSGGPTTTFKTLAAAEDLVIGTATTGSAGSRTYNASYNASSDPITLAPPSAAPGGGAITDGSTSTYYAYTPVTSQYQGHLLATFSFYAQNTNVVVPVIYSAGPFSHVIGYGQPITPLATTELQTFAYIPAEGSNVLQAGQMLGWYTPGAGSIAFDPTGGTGILINPDFGSPVQTGIYPTRALPNRHYYAGFTAIVPEPGTLLLGLGAGALILQPRVRRRPRNG